MPQGDFESDAALLKIGNYQLLRYRMLDKISERFFPKRGRPRPTRDLIRLRLPIRKS